jgi:hypothetical protein
MTAVRPVDGDCGWSSSTLDRAEEWSPQLDDGLGHPRRVNHPVENLGGDEARFKDSCLEPEIVAMYRRWITAIDDPVEQVGIRAGAQCLETLDPDTVEIHGPSIEYIEFLSGL